MKSQSNSMTKPPAKPRKPNVPRTLRHLDTDEQWDERSTENKLSCTASDAAFRLRGIADVLYSTGLNQSHIRFKMAFLGAAVTDIALALERAHKALWVEQEAAS